MHEVCLARSASHSRFMTIFDEIAIPAFASAQGLIHLAADRAIRRATASDTRWGQPALLHYRRDRIHRQAPRQENSTAEGTECYFLMREQVAGEIEGAVFATGARMKPA